MLKDERTPACISQFTQPQYLSPPKQLGVIYAPVLSKQGVLPRPRENVD